MKIEVYLDCFAAQAVHSYRRDAAEPKRSEGSIGESNFADENPKSPTELINTKFAMQKMYANWYHVFLEDSKICHPGGSSFSYTYDTA